MNSAQLVNLILEKLRRVEFVRIINNPLSVKFIWGWNEYVAIAYQDGTIYAHRLIDGVACGPDAYSQHVEGRLNGIATMLGS